MGDVCEGTQGTVITCTHVCLLRPHMQRFCTRLSYDCSCTNVWSAVTYEEHVHAVFICLVPHVLTKSMSTRFSSVWYPMYLSASAKDSLIKNPLRALSNVSNISMGVSIWCGLNVDAPVSQEKTALWNSSKSMSPPDHSHQTTSGEEQARKRRASGQTGVSKHVSGPPRHGMGG